MGTSTDSLQPSSQDMIALSLAVQDRFVGLCQTYMRLRGMELGIPKTLQPDMVRWRTMAIRHRRGDFRNTHAEKLSVRTIAQWMTNVNCELRNQTPKTLTWRD